MPALQVARHELYAQNVAKGMSKREAYVQAGYNVSKGTTSAGKITGNKAVNARIAELLEQRDRTEVVALQKATERLAIDRGWVLQKLVEDHGKASDQTQYSAAIRALELIGRELGMFIERKDVRVQFADLSDDALASAIARYVGGDEPGREAELSRTPH